jgi:methionyl-tRNA formyltransferase
VSYRTLKIIVISDAGSWMLPYVQVMATKMRANGHAVDIEYEPIYTQADIVFFLSYSRIVGAEVLSRAHSNIVVHGSALPKGKGWSPWSWQISKGQNCLALTLFEANESVDAGKIYDQRWITLAGHELVDEWQHIQAHSTIEMCMDFVTNFPKNLEFGKAQIGQETFFPRRTHEDSRIDPSLSLVHQFNLLRVVDNMRYPAFFEHAGYIYEIAITKRGGTNER